MTIKRKRLYVAQNYIPGLLNRSDIPQKWISL